MQATILKGKRWRQQTLHEGQARRAPADASTDYQQYPSYVTSKSVENQSTSPKSQVHTAALLLVTCHFENMMQDLLCVPSSLMLSCSSHGLPATDVKSKSTALDATAACLYLLQPMSGVRGCDRHELPAIDVRYRQTVLVQRQLACTHCSPCLV